MRAKGEVFFLTIFLKNEFCTKKKYWLFKIIFLLSHSNTYVGKKISLLITVVCYDTLSSSYRSL